MFFIVLFVDAFSSWCGRPLRFLAADFVFTVQPLVYAGGVMVILLFVRSFVRKTIGLERSTSQQNAPCSPV